MNLALKEFINQCRDIQSLNIIGGKHNNEATKNFRQKRKIHGDNFNLNNTIRRNFMR